MTLKPTLSIRESVRQRLCPYVSSKYNSFILYHCTPRTLPRPTLPIYRLCPNVILEYNSVQMYPWPPRTLSKPTLPIIESVHQRIWTLDKRNVPMLFCPTASLSTKDSIQTTSVQYRFCPLENMPIKDSIHM